MPTTCLEFAITEDKRNPMPFLKWAGGKRWLVEQYSEIFPTISGRYIEPFLGGGAVFFGLKPAEAILADVNPELISTYRALQLDWKKVVSHLKRHADEHSSDYYYLVREKISTKRSIFSRAADFIYLNRTCWNGLYRVNLAGKFNVPLGTRENILQDVECYPIISALLKDVRLFSQDFEKTIDSAKEGDLLFVDPPYTVKHNNNGFVKYNEKIFSWSDQIRLRDSLVRATKRQVKVIATNAYHGPIKSLYRGQFQLKSLKRRSLIAAKVSSRGYEEELLILS